MSPALSRSNDRSFSVRVFDVLVRACVSAFDASAAVATRLSVGDVGPIALASRPSVAASMRFAPR
jgi:hypothetical protein